MSHPDADITDRGPTDGWVPTEDDLADWARVVLNDLYLSRPRQKASREDFAAAFTATLAALRWRAAFRSDCDHLAFPARSHPLPTIVETFVAAGPQGPRNLTAEMLAVQQQQLNGKPS